MYSSLSMDDLHSVVQDRAAIIQRVISFSKQLGPHLARHLIFHRVLQGYQPHVDASLSPFEQRLVTYIMESSLLLIWDDLPPDVVIIREVHLLLTSVLLTCIKEFPTDHGQYLMRQGYPLTLLQTLTQLPLSWIGATVECSKIISRLFAKNIHMMPVLLQDQFDAHKMVPAILLSAHEFDSVLSCLGTTHKCYVVFLLNMLNLAREWHRAHQVYCVDNVKDLCSSPWIFLIFFGSRKISDDL